MRQISAIGTFVVLGLFVFALVSFAGVSMVVNDKPKSAPTTQPKTAGMIQMAR